MICTYFPGITMAREIDAFNGLRVYTNKGTYVGKVDNVALNLSNKRIRGLLLTGTNPNIIEGGRSILVPYRWVSAIGDIILLSFFPEKVKEEKKEEEEK
jgi:sporulation protein YlmC with PRC-barrel domain